MAERSPIFSTKGDRPQIGYIEGNEAFDLFGRQRCSYSAATGNLCDFDSGKIVGHVSLEGNFVGASWIADELFGQRHDGEADADLRSIAGNPPETCMDTSGNVPVAPDPAESSPSEEELYERAIRMIRSGVEKKP
jgi:hypothetical protein